MVILRSANVRAAVIAALAASAMVLAGCGSASSSSSSTAAAAPAATSSTSSSTTSASSSSSDESGPEEIGTAKGAVGTYLTADEGRAVYLWVADSGGKSTCSGACAKYWPPVETKGKPKGEDGVNAALLGTTTRSDGSEQVTYKGHPLYYFAGDKSAGQVNGQGLDDFGAEWYVLSPKGSKVEGKASSSSSSDDSSSNSGGGY